MAEEEADHGRALAASIGGGQGVALAEGRHRSSTAGGTLRAAVFGVNDGLVSNLALIMGVAGGSDSAQTIVLAGVAGLVAGAGSMAAGEWISVRTQREVYEREIEIERRELEEFPEDEQRELELIYRAKGVEPELAAAMAQRIISNPETALDTLAREELGLDPNDLGSPWGAAISSFLAFALGALIPLLPYLLWTGTRALVTAAALSGAALAGVGALISLLTGRSTVLSALRMLLVGLGAAAVTYGVGALVGVSVG
jgi:VIT1/CCC1 family predicted Fe2+/Mn2+ transporter